MKKLVEYISESYEYTHNLSKSEQDWVNYNKGKSEVQLKTKNKVQPNSKKELIKIINDSFEKSVYDLNFIDTSKIKDMSWLFENVKHNFNISNWDVSNVTNMAGMFYCCKNFDCDLSNWNVSNVTDTHALFYECNKFTGKGLENWDVSAVTDMHYMFYKCKTFNCDLSKWNVSKVTNMDNMFSECKNFNCDLSNWDVSKVTNMDNMFDGCKKFNCDLSDWDISNITLWKNMFDGCNKKTIPDWYK